jgi:hypothetical protein
MNWNETTTSNCRYADVAETIWEDWNIIWEEAYDGYQGGTEFLAEKDGQYSYYEWSYGSCSGCDDWEARELSNDDIKEEMLKEAMWFSDYQMLMNWINNLKKTGAHKVDHLYKAIICYKHPTLVPHL